MNETLVLLSGGLDSAVCLDLAHRQGRRCRCLFIDYGQAAARREEAASHAIAAAYGPWEKLDLPLLTRLTPEQPHVPDRNAAFLLAALTVAISTAAAAVWIGTNAGDRHAFPDATIEFLRSAARVYDRLSRHTVRLEAPLLAFEKGAVQRLAVPLGVPIAKTWSCYGAGPEPCGRCRSCLQKAGLLDCRCPDCLNPPPSLVTRHASLNGHSP